MFTCKQNNKQVVATEILKVNPDFLNKKTFKKPNAQN